MFYQMVDVIDICPARALRALGLLLADGVFPTVGWGGVRLFAASDVSPHENGRNSETKRAIWIAPRIVVHC